MSGIDKLIRKVPAHSPFANFRQDVASDGGGAGIKLQLRKHLRRGGDVEVASGAAAVANLRVAPGPGPYKQQLYAKLSAFLQ